MYHETVAIANVAMDRGWGSIELRCRFHRYVLDGGARAKAQKLLSRPGLEVGSSVAGGPDSAAPARTHGAEPIKKIESFRRLKTGEKAIEVLQFLSGSLFAGK